jgi:hypothetical protein
MRIFPVPDDARKTKTTAGKISVLLDLVFLHAFFAIERTYPSVTERFCVELKLSLRNPEVDC